MGIQDFQTFLDSNCVAGGAVTVDLLKIARQVIQRQRNRLNKAQSLQSPLLRLVLDAECCLDRLYGGYFSDWACGGQWNRMLQFLAILIQATELSGVDLVVFFNGCNEAPRRSEWIQQQLQMRNKVNNVLKHIATKGTPPPKIWWTPPVCLRTSLRMALRHLKVSVMCSMDDHHQEVIAYCRENNFNGLVADDGEYAAFDPPRYFSSEQLKLTYKGSLDTKEYLMSEVNKSLGVSAERSCILAALLGNYILTEQELTDFYKRLNINITGPNKTNIDQSIKIIAAFVKDLPSICKDVVAQKVFGSLTDPRCSKLYQSVQYYINGTKEGFLHYKTSKPNKACKPEAKKPVVNKQSSAETAVIDGNCTMGTSRFASETAESERESLDAYNQATANAKAAPQIVIEPPGLQSQVDGDNAKTEDDQHAAEPTVNGTHNNLLSSSSSGSSSSATSPSHVTTEQPKTSEKPISIPTTVPEVMRTASERHQKGLMSPHIYQILATGEIKLPVLLEDENNCEFPSIHVIYRPVRQMVYAILFNLHHQIFMATKNKEKGDHEKIEVPDIVIKEWIWSKTNPYQSPELIKAEQIGWGVPTIQRLWFGTGIEDKRRRLRGFLTCMKSDTSLMLNISYVPQHLLVMSCVLRYIMSFSDKIKILRRQELDAFIVQAFSPDLMNPQYLQDLQLPLVTFRGVQLATLFMAGVETALLANDACGAPIPWLMCCPWLFFDGKLFHHTLARAAVAKNLLELCGGHIDRVVKVERMRKAITEGFNPVYARPPQPPITPNIIPGFRPLPLTSNGLPVSCALNDNQSRARINRPGNILPRELIRRSVPSRGGQLEIAGVVVGQWGANYGQPGRIQGHQPLQGHLRGRFPPQVPLPRLNARMFQSRGGNNSIATRGKKTQMKATSKKKSAVKKNQENDTKKDSKNRDNTDDEVNADAFSKLSVKDVNAKEKTAGSNQQTDSVVNGGSKPQEKGQGDASLNASQTVKEN
ncbi:constitutive coactivator of PPAR-gamma-like protein 1 homolog isoform X2 [Microplitis mediator]|uniref:constitutive coactivator of PPAR-gamma-like protein 1 homolog isoform X2 n=1 Tax=Microplitis mediator TaxID=375433 RepID=UPI002556A0B5|nr:constitutive coactivator of PPAR-gamma-like protein 1 homolog isoform X2 [Microplitis mediator]